jgi:hypothetical protein
LVSKFDWLFYSKRRATIRQDIQVEALFTVLPIRLNPILGVHPKPNGAQAEASRESLSRVVWETNWKEATSDTKMHKI